MDSNFLMDIEAYLNIIKTLAYLRLQMINYLINKRFHNLKRWIMFSNSYF